MITYTATEIRESLDIPFTYDNPLYGDAIKASFNLYTEAGININVETSEDGLVQTITHSCTDDKAELFINLHAQVVETIENLYQNTDANLPFARVTGIETRQDISFDADNKTLEEIFASHYRTRITS